ncbi:NAD(P)/FAD-dependent oxidoreductase [Sporomusa aerivorans]|uniref:NAD(P)/FAD-dependent oxidoreductase n=1 Tax=Sporomusa aerivorans TaxID=204936 RepID=UPI00352ABD7F
MKTDVLIIGGGLAGLAAAHEVAANGYSAIIADESWSLGGQLRQQTQTIPDMPVPYAGLSGCQLAQTLAERLQYLPVQSLLQHDVIGVYADNSVGVACGGRMEKITPGCIIIATGAAESALPFRGWTLPGIMTIGAAQILMNRERIYPGKKAVVLGSSDMTLEIICQMRKLGIEVVALAEPSAALVATDETILQAFRASGIPVLLHSQPIAATGGSRVEEIILTSGATRRDTRYEVDLVCLDGGRHPVLETISALNCRLAFRKELGGWLPCYSASLETSISGIFVAGQTAGITSQAGVYRTGAIAGLGAVSYLKQNTAENTAEAHSAAKQAHWDGLMTLESARYPARWQARMAHIGI